MQVACPGWIMRGESAQGGNTAGKVSARSGSWIALVSGHPRIATVRLSL